MYIRVKFIVITISIVYKIELTPNSVLNYYKYALKYVMNVKNFSKLKVKH